MNEPVRLVIADDHPMFLYGLAAALAAGSEVEVVGQARDGPSLMKTVERERPDVVLTDLDMPGVDGTSAIAGIDAAFPEIPVLVLSMHSSDGQVLGAIRAGARGYLLKGSGRDEIVRAVLAVAAGGTVFGSGVGRRAAEQLVQGAQTAGFGVLGFVELTGRENEILAHVAAGRSNHDIARRLLLSEKTVRNNVATVLAKLALRDRAAAVAVARDRGWWDPGQ